MKLSICMMVKNEEKNLERCLDSLKPVMTAIESELIVVDTGSEDKTVEIANNYTDKVYFHKWNNDFSEMRNITISYAQGEWIFILDADEEVINPEILIKLFNNGEIDNYNTVTVKERNFVSFQSNYHNEHVTPRIFRNDGTFSYVGAVHNTPVIQQPILNINAFILNHYGYITDDKQLMDQKFSRTTSLLKKELEKDPENIYYCYQLSASYAMHNDKKEALDAIKKAYEVIKNRGLYPKDYVYVYQQLIKCYIVNDMYYKSEEISIEGIKVERDFIDFYYYLGISRIMLEKYDEAIDPFNKYFNLLDIYNQLPISKNTLMIVFTLGSRNEANYNMAFIYYKKNDFKQCIEWLRRINDKKYLKTKLQIVTGAFWGLKDYRGLREFYNENINDGENIESFYNLLELYVSKLALEDKANYFIIFSQGEDKYSNLNKIRMLFNSKDNFEAKVLLENLMSKLDLNMEPNYYGDLLYFSFILGVNIEKYENLISEAKFGEFLTYIFEQYKDMRKFAVEYLLENSKQNSYEYTKFKMILARSVLLFDEELTDDEYNQMFKIYVDYGIRYITAVYKVEIFSGELIYNMKNESEAFLAYMLLAKENEATDDKKYIEYLKKALKVYPILNRGVKIMLEGYNQRKISKNQELEIYKNQVKENISSLINSGDLKNAIALIKEYESIVIDDIEIYSMKSIIYIMEGNLSDAESVLLKALEINSKNFDVLYNLGYLYALMNKFMESIAFYESALENCIDDNMKNEIEHILEKIREEYGNQIMPKKKLVFFVKEGMDSFLGDIIETLSREYEVKKIIVTQLNQIDENMEWADICWFEWCDELVAYGSRYNSADKKKLICRLHRYEAFTNYIENVEWKNIDKVIFVSEHIRDVVTSKVDLPADKCEIVYNGINLNKFKYYERTNGFNLAWIGYLNLRKNPMLVIQYFKELVKTDKRYKLFFAGSFQDEPLYYYIKNIIEKLDLKENVQFDGFIPNDKMSDWLKDKNYVVTGSIAEGHPVGVMEAMASGIKPVIHYFPGADNFYPEQYIYYDISDFLNITKEENYDSREYRNFIETNYSLNKQIKNIQTILKKLFQEDVQAYRKIESPLVSVCIPVYNGEEFIKFTIDSILNQTYRNLEIIICDNCSTDNTIKIVESYDDKRIKLYKNKKNIGLLNNANKCIELSSGEYIKFVFSDDTIHRNAIEEMIHVMEEHSEISLCGVNFSYIDEKNKIVSQPILNLATGKYERKSFFKKLVIDGNIIGCPSAVMIRKKVLNETGLFSDDNNTLKYMSDYDMWIKLCKAGDYFFINKSYMNFRVHSNSITSEQISSIKRVNDFYYLLNKYIDISFSDSEIKNAYDNANHRCFFSLKANNNLNEKLEIIDCIIKNSKYISEEERLELLKLKNSISSNLKLI